ncbi:hypothetical protein ASF57_12165 [Methylobacterium sp. Leaf117]|nr:hypothetical protein ASF57_12165 [Methylobacterium sp. Leaf117]
MVFALSRREALHADLRRRFLALLADLEDDNVKNTARRMRALFGDEPPTFHAVDKLAYNAAMTALDRPAAYQIVVTPWQRLLRNWRRYEGVPFPRREDVPRKT